MAQKPVANALTLELEPVVADNLARYLETANEWYAHDFVPFDQGENFAFLGGKDWDASQVTLPSDVVDALEVLLVTKDNLAGYHRELVEHFILENKWGRWLGRWTAEENRHGIVMRDYLVVTRAVDPVELERFRMEHMTNGYSAPIDEGDAEGGGADALPGHGAVHLLPGAGRRRPRARGAGDDHLPHAAVVDDEVVDRIGGERGPRGGDQRQRRRSLGYEPGARGLDRHDAPDRQHRAGDAVAGFDHAALLGRLLRGAGERAEDLQLGGHGLIGVERGVDR